MSSPCSICNSLRSRHDPLELRRLEAFRLRSHAAPVPIAGWTIIDLIRHAETLDQLTEEESRELGSLLVRTSAAIRAATGCERVYLLAFAEAARHVHVHLVPRHGHDPRTDAWAVADHYRAVAEGRAAPATESDSIAIAQEVAARVAGGL